MSTPIDWNKYGPNVNMGLIADNRRYQKEALHKAWDFFVCNPEYKVTEVRVCREGKELPQWIFLWSEILNEPIPMGCICDEGTLRTSSLKGI